MFSSSYQSGFISIFFSVGSNPLALWDKQVKNGHIRRIIDDEVKSLVLDIGGTNVATTYITCPIKPRASLGVRLPFLVMVIKNVKKYFTFEIQILDDKDMRRRFRISNFQSTTKVSPFCTTMPIGLSEGWNQVQFNLADFTKRAYGSTYIEAVRVQIHANVRIRRIYFTNHLSTDEEMPNEFKLFGPGGKGKAKESIKPEEGKRPSQEKPPGEIVPPLPSPVEMDAPTEVMDGAPPTPTSPVADEASPDQPEGEMIGGEEAGVAPTSEQTTAEGAEPAAETEIPPGEPVLGDEGGQPAAGDEVGPAPLEPIKEEATEETATVEASDGGPGTEATAETATTEITEVVTVTEGEDTTEAATSEAPPSESGPATTEDQTEAPTEAPTE